MKIQIIEPAQISPYIEIGLEIAEKEANNGNKVYYCHIGKKLPYLIWHPRNKGLLHLIYFFFQKKKIKSVLNPNIKYFDKLLLSKSERSVVVSREFKTLEELKAFKWQGYDAGMGAASTLISFTREPNPDIEKYSKLILKILKTYILVQKSAEKWIQKVKPDKVYFLNGRLAEARPILRVCQKMGIPFGVYDSGHDKFTYSCRNFEQHDLLLLQKEYLLHWENSKHNNRIKTAYAEKYFLKNRLKSYDDYDFSFTKNQTENLLPEKWDANKKNIIFFTSSTDEYEATSDLFNIHNIFDDQVKAIEEILSFYKNKNDCDFYVRIHPHAQFKGAGEQKLWTKFQTKYSSICIPYNSPVDSYKLMDECDIVLTYGSTIGVEASYWGKPSICVARSHYFKLLVSYFPSDKEELWHLLDSGSIRPINEDCMKYGYYKMTFGIPFVFFKIKTLYIRKFKNKDINGGRALKFIKLLSFFRNYIYQNVKSIIK